MITRRRSVTVTLVALIVSSIAVQGVGVAAVGAPRLREYRGRTSAGGKIGITTVLTEVGVRVSELRFGWDLTCDDGTEFGMGLGIFFVRGPVLEPTRIDLDLPSPADALHLHGRLGVHQGSGTLAYVLPALTEDERPQACTTGELTWHVDRLSDLGTRSTPSELQGARVVTTRPMPGVSRTVAFGSLTPSETGPPRHYRGRTSQATSMRVVMTRMAGGVALRTLGFELTMTCDDGTAFGLSSGYGWFPGAPMQRARIDLDEVDFMQALHVHGDLTIHFGSGTLSLIWPTLDPDEQPQLCAARDLTWTAWRTDPGKRAS